MSVEIVPFDYHGRLVRTVTIAGEPWFVVNDLCAVLELNNVTAAVRGIKKADIKSFEVSSSGQTRKMLIVSEPGFYRLILRSYKPQAGPFQDWVCREVIPSIRKTGKFQIALPFLVPAAQAWIKTFDDDFYANIFRLKGRRPVTLKDAPWLAQVTNDIVYRRLPEGVFQALQILNPVLPGRKHRAKKQHQFVEPTMARRHLDRLLNRCTGMMIGFVSWNEFYASWDRTYPIKRDLPGHYEFKFADQQELFPFMFDTPYERPSK